MFLDKFHKGTDFRVYNYYGAHITNDGYIFRVWAPNAYEIYVECDLNDFEKLSPMLKMTKLNGDGDFELKLCTEKQIFKYRYRIIAADDVFVKNDPFGFSSRVQEQTYFSEIFDVDSYVWKDKNWLEYRKKKDPIESPLNIYEVHLGSWQRDECGQFLNYKEIAEKLVPYIKDMGYTHIELLPLAEHPFYGSWGYQTCGYYSPTERYGSPSDLMYLIDLCHCHGIGVIMDWMPAGFPKDSHGLYKFDGSFCFEYNDESKRIQPAWDICMFDLGKAEVRSFLISNAFFWIEKYHVDGLRTDAVSSMIFSDFGKKNGEWKENKYGGRENLEAIDFLRKINGAVLNEHPDVMMIAEETEGMQMVSRPIESEGLGFTFKWNTKWTDASIEYFTVDPFFRKNYHNNVTIPASRCFAENYILPISHDASAHDKDGLFGKMFGENNGKFSNMKVLLGYMIAHPGKKLTFMGNEFGQVSAWDHDSQLDWNILASEDHRVLKKYTKELNMFYLEHSALWKNDRHNDSFIWISNDDKEQNIIAFMRKAQEEQLIFIFNFAPVTRYDYRIGVPYDGEYDEIFTSDSLCFNGTGISNDHIEAYPFAMHGFNRQISLTISPLSMICLKRKC